MSAHIRVRVEPSISLVRQRFDAFAIGDVVLVESNQAIGLKVDPTSIKFLTTAHGTPVEHDCGLAQCVTASKTYLVPRAVELKVTR